jgi:ubiquinone/menaquinone biosynthesis C-methylase UbiE
LGCGTLRVTKRLLSMGFERIIAVDLLSELMLYGYEKIRGEDKNRIILVQADVRYLPIRANMIDLAISLELFEHMDSPMQFLLEVKRILNLNKWALINTWNAVTPGNKRNIGEKGKSYYENGFFYVFYELKEIRELLDRINVDYVLKSCGCALGRRILHILGDNLGRTLIKPLAIIDDLLSFFFPSWMFPFLFFRFRKLNDGKRAR